MRYLLEKTFENSKVVYSNVSLCVCVFLFTAVSSAPRTFSGTKLVLNEYVLSDCEEKAKIKQMFHVKKYFLTL